jgi:hypothetical protein
MTTVGLRVNLGVAESWITTRRSYGTVLAGGLANISITSGQMVPGTRQQNGHSLYVIMDVKPLRDMRTCVANNLAAQNPIKTSVLLEELKKQTGISDLNEVDVLQQLRNVVEDGAAVGAGASDGVVKDVMNALSEIAGPAQADQAYSDVAGA